MDNSPKNKGNWRQLMPRNSQKDLKDLMIPSQESIGASRKSLNKDNTMS